MTWGFGDCQYRVVEVAGRIGPVGVTGPDGFVGVHGVAGQHHLHGVSHADQPRVDGEIRRPCDPQDRMGDGGVVGQVDEVAGRRQFRSAGHRVSVDLGDDRLGQVP